MLGWGSRTHIEHSDGLSAPNIEKTAALFWGKVILNNIGKIAMHGNNYSSLNGNFAIANGSCQSLEPSCVLFQNQVGSQSQGMNQAQQYMCIDDLLN